MTFAAPGLGMEKVRGVEIAFESETRTYCGRLGISPHDSARMSSSSFQELDAPSRRKACANSARSRIPVAEQDSFRRFFEEGQFGFSRTPPNPMDIDYLVAKFRSDEDEDRRLASAQFRRSDGAPVASSYIPEEQVPEKGYEVSLASMGVTVDPSVSQDRLTALEQQIKNSFLPAFGSRLAVQVKAAPLLETAEPGFFDRLEKFQKLALALIIAAAVIFLALLLKLIPARRTPHQLEFSHKNTSEPASVDSDHEEEEEPVEEPEERAPALPPPAPPQAALPEPAPDPVKEAARLEVEIAEIVRQNPALSRVMIQDFLRTDFDTLEGVASTEAQDAMLRVALLLETLARFKIQGEKLNVKGNVLKEFQKIRSKLSEISPHDKVRYLGETYWGLVAFSFLSEGDQSFPPFHFLEMLDDSKIARLLTTEKPELQAAVLLGMSEKKSARVLQKVPSQTRQSIFELMCSGKIPDIAELKALAERVKAKSVTLLAAQNLPTSAEEGISAIAMLLGQLDFKAQFESVKTLFTSAPELRKQLKAQIFFVALLPESRAEFLATVFTDRPSEWTKTVVAAFGESFQSQVLEVLPSMQQRMLQSANLSTISHAAQLKTMQELQSEIRAKIEKKELSLEEIFDLTETQDATHDSISLATAA